MKGIRGAPRFLLSFLQQQRNASTKRWDEMGIHNRVTDLIGNTPLVYLNKMTEGCHARVAAKLESFNPMNSVKDRPAMAMIESAEQLGLINPNKTLLVEATSGNTGIALAYIAAVRGYRLILTMPATMSIERRCLLRAFGAQLVLTPGHLGMRGARLKADEIVTKTRHAYYLGQFENPANTLIHRETTGPELWRDTCGQMDVFVSGVGTAGTLTGVAEYFKHQGSDCKFVAVEPEESPVLQGKDPGPHKIEGIGAGFVPAIYQSELVDEIMGINIDQACKASTRLAREEGILAGISAGASCQAALDLAKRPENKDKLIVFVVASFGERYLTTVLFDKIREEAINMPVHSVFPQPL